VTRYYFNGELVEGDLSVPPDAPALRLGLGVFDTVLWREGQAMHLERHLRRMTEAGQHLGIQPPADDHRQAICSLLQSSPLASHEARVNLHWLVLNTGAPTVLMVRATEYIPPDGTAGVDLTLYPGVQESHLAVFKTHSSAHYHLASQYAAERGFFDAVLVDSRGKVLEASRGTLVIRRGGRLVVPDSKRRMRSMSLEILSEHVVVNEGEMAYGDLRKSDCCFYLNSLVGALTVQRVDDAMLTADLDAAREYSRWIRG
jgi:branched-subunit amino acid aminotransferase/4-amino-4-deoxychorismate lyase